MQSDAAKQFFKKEQTGRVLSLRVHSSVNAWMLEKIFATLATARALPALIPGPSYRGGPSPHSSYSHFKPSLPHAQIRPPVPWVPGLCHNILTAPTAAHPPQPCSASLAGGPGMWDQVPGLEYSRKSPRPAVELRTPRGQHPASLGSVNALAVFLRGEGPALCPGLVHCFLQVKLLGEAHLDHLGSSSASTQPFKVLLMGTHHLLCLPPKARAAGGD